MTTFEPKKKETCVCQGGHVKRKDSLTMKSCRDGMNTVYVHPDLGVELENLQLDDVGTLLITWDDP